ncbi:MAG: cupin domain-containing protein [Acidobacteria bacterium]|nr:cupin domain-containing protein [Acidobacteriota bacterium]
MNAIDVAAKFENFTDTWHPHKIAAVDDSVVLLAKLQGDFLWHAHPDEDELFFVVRGTLHMQFRDRTEVVRPGELIVVPRGVEHCPKTVDDEVVHVLLFEKSTTDHTGDTVHERTVTEYPEI